MKHESAFNREFVPAPPSRPAGHSAFRLHGALFFGAVKLIEDMEKNLPVRALVLDFQNVIYIDSSGTDALMDLLRSCPTPTSSAA